VDQTADRSSGATRPRGNQSRRDADAEPVGSGTKFDGRSGADAHARRHPDSDPHPNADIEPDTGDHPQCNASAGHRDADADRNTSVHAHADTEPDPEPDPDPDSDRHTVERVDGVPSELQ
jgi:hypothetical protein